MTDILYVFIGAAAAMVMRWVVDSYVSRRRAVARFVLRNYWNEQGNHRPYVGMIHSADDPEKATSLDDLLTGYAYERGADGSTLEVVVTDAPLVSGTWRLTRSHVYEWVERDRPPFEPEAAP